MYRKYGVISDIWGFCRWCMFFFQIGWDPWQPCFRLPSWWTAEDQRKHAWVSGSSILVSPFRPAKSLRGIADKNPSDSNWRRGFRRSKDSNKIWQQNKGDRRGWSYPRCPLESEFPTFSLCFFLYVLMLQIQALGEMRYQWGLLLCSWGMAVVAHSHPYLRKIAILKPPTRLFGHLAIWTMK